MLGSLIQTQTWRWTAVGKHPTAADYIHLDNGSPLISALSDWVAKGYDHINNKGQKTPGPYSWRFWVRGPKKGNLICGIGRDSSDRIGRPYPLLIMGEGFVKKWEKQWDKLTRCFLKTWQRMEYVAAQRFEDLDALAHALKSTPQPEADLLWSSKDVVTATAGIAYADIESCRSQLKKEGRALVSLAGPGASDPEQEALQWHAIVKRCGGDIPRAVFWGGTPRRTYLAICQNALNTTDFVTLWSA